MAIYCKFTLCAETQENKYVSRCCEGKGHLTYLVDQTPQSQGSSVMRNKWTLKHLTDSVVNDAACAGVYDSMTSVVPIPARTFAVRSNSLTSFAYRCVDPTTGNEYRLGFCPSAASFQLAAVVGGVVAAPLPVVPPALMQRLEVANVMVYVEYPNTGCADSSNIYTALEFQRLLMGRHTML